VVKDVEVFVCFDGI